MEFLYHFCQVRHDRWAGGDGNVVADEMGRDGDVGVFGEFGDIGSGDEGVEDAGDDGCRGVEGGD